MNQKAQRSEIQFPLLLNLQEDRPRVASDFRSVEKMNAPFINGMHSPLWKNTYEFTSKPVYDYKNNRYEIIDGYLTRNGEELFQVENRHFKREDVTEEYSKYLAFDFDQNGMLAKLEWDTGTNTIEFEYGNGVMAKHLFVNGIILASRVKIVNGNVGIAVTVFVENGQTKMCYMNTATNVNEIKNIVWCTTQPKTSTGANFVVNTLSISNPAPIINICYTGVANTYGVSLVSNYGEVLYTREEGYYTLVDANGTITDGTNWIAANGTATETIRNYNITNFIFDSKNSSTPNVINVYNRDDKWYYAADPTTEVPNSGDITFNPQLLAGQTIEYEGVMYNLYRVVQYSNRIIFTANVDSLYGNAATIQVLFSDGFTSEVETFSGDNSSITIDHSSLSWSSLGIKANEAEIIYNSESFVTVPNTQFTITKETTPTTVQAAYITFPNVFLDNGNLYSWYTIPSANTSSSGFALTLVQNSLVVESGTFTGFDGNGKFTFDVIESHLVNTYTKYARENSIAIAQNFWNSSLKMNSDGIRTPYQIYVSKQAAETISASVKYTEYSNSNCSDMLYYAGTAPKNDQKFYNYATNNSEDVAWFNPGGFRSSIDGNWNILYYVDDSGSVAIQGISYSENDAKMGTLVTPFASLADNSYISACNDFVVYKDAHNKYYKISIEEGAVLSSIFDNKYIIVNTTSYWNMWDESNTRKFHYATDYNNRTKLGLNRTEYRSTISTYFVKADMRKYVSSINNNYNILPRLPVTSMLPISMALRYLPADVDAASRIKTYQSSADEAREVQSIDVYFQSIDKTDTSYLASVKVYTSGNQIYRDNNLVGLSYADSKSILFITDIFTTFINGAGNNDFAVEGVSKYPLIYNNQNKPMFLYNFVSGIDVDDVKWFFVIQGQYYAVIGEKLYAMIYSNGLISQSDAIIDIRDLKYVGNTPAIAFFVNPYTKQVYSFTGDANLQQIFDASKFVFDVKENEITHFYDESTQSIYIKTNKGLIVFGPQNTYLLEDFTDTTDIEFVDGDIHIIGENKVDTLRYYHDREGYEDLPIVMETSFFGLGSNELATIDKWQITLYDPEHREQDIELCVRSLTDVTTVAETKKLHIAKNEWDKWSHSVLVGFNPKIIRGQGIRLSVTSHSAIQKIVPHVMDLKAPQNGNSKFSV